MTVAFDCIEIAVPDYDSAVADYQLLFDCTLSEQVTSEGVRRALLALGNTTMALVETNTNAAHVSGLVLSRVAHEGAPKPIENSLGLNIRVCGQAQSVSPGKAPHSVEVGPIVDHVVLRTNDANSCIGLFERDLGVRLALDQTVEKWGGRMLFFRAGKMTLEVIASDKVDVSAFWGVAYQCNDINAFCARLQSSAVEVSDVREGRKPGTRVATLKSHCLDIPTLLIQQTTKA